MNLQQYYPLPSGESLAPGLSISTRYLFAYNPTPGGGAITKPVTVTASFGTGPYTYLWHGSGGGGGGAITPSAPTSATTTFGASASGAHADYIETKICTVTDSLLATQSISLTVEILIGSSP